jgi:hypothetical protein
MIYGMKIEPILKKIDTLLRIRMSVQLFAGLKCDEEKTN